MSERKDMDMDMDMDRIDDAATTGTATPDVTTATAEACDFRDSLDRLAAAGVTVLGVSKDPIAPMRRFAERDRLTFPLLSDPDLAVHRLYGAWGGKKLSVRQGPRGRAALHVRDRAGRAHRHRPLQRACEGARRLAHEGDASGLTVAARTAAPRDAPCDAPCDAHATCPGRPVQADCASAAAFIATAAT